MRYLLVFDLFGVVFSKGLASSLDSLVAAFNRPEERVARVYRRFEPDFDRGTINEIQFWDEINRELGTRMSPETLTSLVITAYQPQRDALALARFYGKHAAVVVFSNYRREWFDRLARIHKVDDVFHAVHLSSDIGHLKPEREAFEYLCETYGFAEGSLILVDDEIANVQGMRDFGGQAILYRNAYEAEVEIRRILGETAPDYDASYAGILLTTRDGALVLQRRDLDPLIENPGKLSVFGGRLLPAESHVTCAKRELEEETGLSIPEERFHPVGEFGFPVRGKEWTHCVYFVVSDIDINDIKLKEGSGIEVRFPRNALRQEDLTLLPRVLIARLVERGTL